MVYLDNAATTKPSSECLKIYNEINAERYFNPSASYSISFNLFKELHIFSGVVSVPLLISLDGKF